jgi:hypothetical protein
MSTRSAHGSSSSPEQDVGPPISTIASHDGGAGLFLSMEILA